MTARRLSAPRVDHAASAIGVTVGVPGAIAVAAALAVFRSLFDATNAALVLVLVVVAVAAVGGRAAGIVTALAAVISFDFFHTEPYLSLAIDSRDDVETTVLLLLVAVVVGTISSHGRSARRREGSSRSQIRRVHRVAEAAVSGRPPAEVISAAQDELRALLSLQGCRFEALPVDDPGVLARIGRSGAIEGATSLTYGRGADGRGGFELPARGAELLVMARGHHIGRFVLVPTPGLTASLEARLVAVAIADQVAAVWIPTEKERAR